MILTDPQADLYARRRIEPGASLLDAIRSSYNELATHLDNSGRTPVQVEVTVRVAPQ